MSFSEPIEKFFTELAILEGKLYHLDTALRRYSESYTKNMNSFKNNIPDFALGTTLIISDLTGETENGWVINYPTNGQHSVKLSEYEQETIQLINRETGYTLSHAYEVFTTFLKDQLKIIFKINPKLLVGLSNSKRIIVEQLLDGNRVTKSGKNNKELFGILRRSFKEYESHENLNNSGINLQSWYNAFSFFRHVFIHSRGKFSSGNKDFNNLSNESKIILNTYFPYDQIGEEFKFNINKDCRKQNIKLIAEYGYLIFKHTAIELDQNWRILQNMKE